VVGAHYLPFVFLYGMSHFAVLGGAMITAGLAIGLYVPGSYGLGGWVGASLLVLFGFVGGNAVAREEGRKAA